MKKVVALVLAVALLLGTMSFAAAEEKTKLTALFIAHPLTKSVTEMKWLSEIADAVGYDSVDHFSRTFRKVYGTAPLDYRKNH